MCPRQRDVLPIEFDSATSGGTGPLTWSQTAMWEVIHWLPPDDVSTNLVTTVRVPTGRSTEDTLAALRAVLERHDALRTTFHRTEDGEIQTIHRSGQLPVRLCRADADVDTTVHAVSAQLRGQPFRIATDLPCRAALVLRDDRPTTLVLACSHLAVDGWSLEIVREDLAALLDGVTELPERAQQPLARAEFERGETMRRRGRAALDHWASCVRGLPPCMVEQLPPDPDAVTRWWRISSPAIALALRRLAARHRIGESIAVQAAVLLLLSEYRDEPSAGLRSIVATRFRPETRRMVAAFNQNALLCLSRADAATVGEFVDRARAAALLAYRHCECPPRELEDVIATVCAERGFTAGSFCFFNDIRYSRHGDRERAVSSADVTAALPRTRIGPHDLPSRPKGSKFFLYLGDVADDAVLTLGADPRFLAPRTPRDCLRDLETVLVTAATRPDIPVTDVLAR